MNLPNDLLKEFAKSVAPKEAVTRPTEVTAYGTVISTSGKTAMVQLDGSSSQTPATMTIDAKSGDRVTVLIKDHRAILNGNLTAPATARADDRYMRFTSDGLMIGRLDVSGNPTGYYILIQDDAYLIKNASGTTVARYAGNEITMYDTNGNVIGVFKPNETVLNGGDGTIKAANNVLYLMGEVAAGLRSVNVTSGGSYLAEAVVEHDTNDPKAAIQVSVGSRKTSMIVDKNGAYVNTPGLFYVNSKEVLSTDNLVAYGEIFGYGTIGANTVREVDVRPNIPSGYVLNSFRSVSVFRDNSDHTSRTRVPNLIVSESYIDTGIGLARAWVTNTGANSENILVRFQWTALKMKTPGTITPTYVDIDA